MAKFVGVAEVFDAVSTDHTDSPFWIPIEDVPEEWGREVQKRNLYYVLPTAPFMLTPGASVKTIAY